MMSDAERFLEKLFRQATEGCVELRLIAPRGRGASSIHFALGEWKEAAAAAIKLAPDRNVFFGAIPRAGKNRRNVDEDAPATVVWADIDTAEAVSALSAFSLPPSITVKSGTGSNVHAYWVLDSPIAARHAVAVNRALASHLGADSRSTDASRILRVPDTLNHKQTPATAVELASLNDRVYELRALRHALDIPAVPSSDSPADVHEPTDPSPSVTQLLARLDGVVLAGETGWSARCPAHDDEHPSLAVAQGEDGRCLLHCHAGCAPEAVVTAVGLTLSDLFPAATTRPRPSDATRLVDMVEQEAELFHDPLGAAYASLQRDGHRETHALDSRGFIEWMQRRFFQEHRKVPGAQVTSSALTTLRGLARFDGPEEKVWTRVAEQDGSIWLDLGDEQWRAAAVNADGWRVVDEPEPRFVRPAAALPLPVPRPGGSIDALREMVNVADEDWPLVKGWMVSALMPAGPFPFLVFNGEQGTAKSMSAEFLRSTIDPVMAARRAMPRTERDLAISAANGWCLLLDNVTNVTVEQSNALCRLSTGGGFATRELYTDRAEVYFDLMRPVLMTGIDISGLGEDLRERAITLELPTISTVERREERELRNAFGEAHPTVLGAVLEAASCALRRRSEVLLDSRPRMADAAAIMTAAEPALGVADGTIVDAFISNQRDTSSFRLGEDPLARTLMHYLGLVQAFEGTHTELLSSLGSALPGDTEPDDLPRNPQQLSRCLKQIAPALRLAGYQVKYPRRGHRGTRTIVLRDARDA